MKLLYATSALYPSPRANRIQTRAMAHSFAHLLGEDFFFGVRAGGEHTGLPPRTYPMRGRTSIVLAAFYTSFILRNGITHVFCREERLLYFILLFCNVLLRRGIDATFEAHFVPDHTEFFFDSVVRQSSRTVVLTSHTATILRARSLRLTIMIAPDAVDVKMFSINTTQEECRDRLGIPPMRRIVMYCGHLYPWKGAHMLAEVATRDRSDTLYYFVGGAPEDIERFKKEYGMLPTIVIVGHRPHSEVPEWMKAADVLVLPTSAQSSIGRLHTSPLKLFEYMASGVPIVASDLPSTREVLSSELALLVAPDDVDALRDGIAEVWARPEVARARSLRARHSVEEHTWDKRAQHIVEYIQA